jgi:hypothetical protein
LFKTCLLRDKRLKKKPFYAILGACEKLAHGSLTRNIRFCAASTQISKFRLNNP